MKFWDFIPAKSLVWDPIKKSTGLTDAQMALLAGTAVAAPFVAPALAASAPAAGAAAVQGGAATAAGGAATAGATGASAAAPAAGWEAYAKPAMTAMQGASMAQGLLANQSQPVQAAPLQHQQANFSGLLTPDTVAQDQQRRMQQQQMVMQGLLGGYRG